LIWFELGRAQSGLKKYDDALTTFKKALDLANAAKKPDTDLISEAEAGLGEVYARTGKTDDASAQFDLAAKSNPTKAETYLTNEAAIFYNMGSADAQGVAADKAIAADPKNALPYYLKGQALISIAGAAGKLTMDPKTNLLTLPPGCAEAYNKYLELAPTGPHAQEAKDILAQAGTKIETKVSNKKK
jgi:tetratricopeptide (TPR) repeat protein